MILRYGLWSALILLSAYGSVVQAAHLSADDAWQRAVAELGVAAPSVAPMAKVVPLDDGGGAYYVFGRTDRPEGCIVASADSRMRPVLAVTDQGVLDASDANLPPALRQLMQSWGQELAWAEQGLLEPMATVTENYRNWTPVEPLLVTKWGQDAPYNQACPTNAGVQAVTGCEPTAMAQIIAYHKWANPRGAHSYQCGKMGNATVSYTYTGHSFDWANMPQSLSSSSTAAQKAAVADLMLACGVAVTVGYGPDASGADPSVVHTAMPKYFGYSVESVGERRAWYSTATYEQLIYEELSARRPVFYWGTGKGGHAFVCDGYLSDGLFHINWGWEGNSDGYFALTALNPKEYGTGGTPSSLGYNNGQGFCRVVPATSGHATGYTRWQVQGSNLRLNSASGKSVGVHTSYYAEFGDEGTTSIQLGLRVTTTTGNIVGTVASGYTNNSLNRFGGAEIDFTTSLSSVGLGAYGTYYVYPVYKCTGQSDWLPVRYGVTDCSYIQISCDGSGNITSSSVPVPSQPQVDVVAFKPYYTMYAGVQNNFSIDVINTTGTDRTEAITVKFANGSTERQVTLNATTVPAGRYANLKGAIEVGDDGVSLPAGTYTVSFPGASSRTYSVTVFGGTYPLPSINASVRVLAMDAIPLMHHRGESWNYEINAYCTTSGITRSFAVTFRGLDGKLAKSVQVASHGFLNDQVGKCITLTPDPFVLDLEPGIYNVTYTSGVGGAVISDTRQITVGQEIDGVVYGFDPTAKTAKVLGLADAGLTQVVVPAAVTILGEQYTVKAVVENAFDKGGALRTLSLPATVTTLENAALQGLTNVERLALCPDTKLITYPILNCSGLNRSVSLYVPASQRSAYQSTFGSDVAAVYSLLSAFTAPATQEVAVGASVDVTPVYSSTSGTDTGFTAVSSDVSKAMVSVSGTTLSIRGVADGNCAVTLTPNQPGLAPVEIAVTVGGGTVVQPPTPGDDTYCTPAYKGKYGDKTRKNFYLRTLTVSDEDSEVDIQLQSDGTYTERPIFYDCTSSVLTTKAGREVRVRVQGYGWSMHAATYMDADQNGFTNADRVYSSGSVTAVYDGNAFAFTLPASLAAGRYRVRHMIDWDCADPCSVGENANNDNGEVVVDFIIEVRDAAVTPPQPPTGDWATHSSEGAAQTSGAYTTLTGTRTNDRGNLTAFSASVDGTVTDLGGVTGTSYYNSKLDKVVNVRPGQTVTFTTAGYNCWTHAFLYVDFREMGFTEGDCVWFDRYAADGSTYRDFAGNAVSGVEPASGDMNNTFAFTVPDDAPAGYYRARYRTTWNAIDPNVKTSEGSTWPLCTDFLIRVVDEVEVVKYNLTVPDVSQYEHLGGLTLSARGAELTSGTTVSLEENTPVTVVATPAQGYVVENIRVHGDEINNGASFLLTADTDASDIVITTGAAPLEYCHPAGQNTTQASIDKKLTQGRTLQELYIKLDDNASRHATVGGMSSRSEGGGSIYLAPRDYYRDNTATVVNVAQGDTLHIYPYGRQRTGENLLSNVEFYVYLDMDCNAAFDVDLGEMLCHTPLDSYSDGRKAINPIVVPHALDEGNYRMRVKLDVGSDDPCRCESDQGFVDNGGQVIDFTLHVAERAHIAMLNRAEGNGVVEIGRRLVRNQSPVQGRFTDDRGNNYDILTDATPHTIAEPLADGDALRENTTYWVLVHTADTRNVESVPLMPMADNASGLESHLKSLELDRGDGSAPVDLLAQDSPLETLGVPAGSSNKWYAFPFETTDAKGTYTVSADFETRPTISGIDVPGYDAADSSIEYYTLQGVKVAKGFRPAPGVYLLRRGFTTHKVLVR